MKRLITLLLPTVLCLYPPLVEAQAFKTESGRAEFTSEVPLHTFTGTSNNLVGRIDLSDSTVDFYIDMNTFDTGISKRDRDMKRTLETDKYPFAEFYGKLISDFKSNSNSPQEATVRGKFSIHGVTREVEITGTLQKTKEGLKVIASWTINIENYNIEPPGILFYRVDENQDVKIEATLTPTEQNIETN